MWLAQDIYHVVVQNLEPFEKGIRTLRIQVLDSSIQEIKKELTQKVIEHSWMCFGWFYLIIK